MKKKKTLSITVNKISAADKSKSFAITKGNTRETVWANYLIMQPKPSPHPNCRGPWKNGYCYQKQLKYELRKQKSAGGLRLNRGVMTQGTIKAFEKYILGPGGNERHG
ncbi:hypothetical protein CDAR_84971 [Caerostris darwini]|uniref:Uncharacterized protein n=1 Tax=Caerostris darwini TaxID=1538125 RepID=A0AAV4N313_9ARAC|nr:hypothetical protein CDAR_84971 [Caerostris darwini]